MGEPKISLAVTLTINGDDKELPAQLKIRNRGGKGYYDPEKCQDLEVCFQMLGVHANALSLVIGSTKNLGLNEGKVMEEVIRMLESLDIDSSLGIKHELTIEIDTESEHQVIISKPKKLTPKNVAEARESIILDYKSIVWSTIVLCSIFENEGGDNMENTIASIVEHITGEFIDPNDRPHVGSELEVILAQG